MLTGIRKFIARQSTEIRMNVRAVLLATRDPRVPWYAKALAVAVAAYAFSPIDLIPDFIPVLGYLDDVILVPLGVRAVIRMIPPDVWRELQERAREQPVERSAWRWLAAACIALLWIVSIIAVIRFFPRHP